MKVFVLFLALFAITMQQAPAAVNRLDTCLRTVKATTDLTLRAAQYGLTKNFLDMAKLFLESGADRIQSYEDCKLVVTQDVWEWIAANVSRHGQDCIKDSVAVYMLLQNAGADMHAGASYNKILADWAAVMGGLDDVSNRCMWG